MSVSHPDIVASACENVAKAVPEVLPLFESEPVVDKYHVAPGVDEVLTVTVCIEVTEPAASVAVSV
jgi:hypothetical protein